VANLSIYKIGKTTNFSGDAAEMKAVLGGKAASLAQMTQLGLRVPSAFVITTKVCNDYLNKGPTQRVEFLDSLMNQVDVHDLWLKQEFGYLPLVAVRSGAPVSMPGMMDTILNVGLTDGTFKFWADKIGERAALDSYRRLIQMLGSCAYGVDKDVFEKWLTKAREDAGCLTDAELGVSDLQSVVGWFLNAFKLATGRDFPNDRSTQLRAAIKAVFESWMNERAIEYRKLNKIDGGMGTAVTVQAMVFGNTGDASGTGVLFTRNPASGANEVYGEFLVNAQGEDVVAGVRTPLHMDDMAGLSKGWASVAKEIAVACERLEDDYDDMVDVEFTVQDGVLYILQSRVGKRSGLAAVVIAHDLAQAGVIGVKEALARISKEQFRASRRPLIDPKFKKKANFVGKPASPGVVTGKPVFSSADAVKAKGNVILITHETTPNDIAGMNAAVGILTQTGGATSHAAVVARGMDKACVTGCTNLDWNVVKAAKSVTIDGATGKVWIDVNKNGIADATEPSATAVPTGGVIPW